MHPWDWAGLLLGLGIVALTIGDLWITIFHKDFEGPIAKGIQNGIWRLIILVARRISRGRRLLVSMAGPVMVFSTLAAWLSLYLLGFAIAVWPQLHDQFLTEQSIDPTRLGFIDALYYSGVTGTTLGYGDIVPKSGLFKVLAFVQSGFGFVILTATITYLLGIIGGSAERNSLAVRVFSQTQGSGDGVEIVAASLATEDVADLRRRLDASPNPSTASRRSSTSSPSSTSTFAGANPITTPNRCSGRSSRRLSPRSCWPKIRATIR